MNYFARKFSVWPAEDGELHSVEKWLTVLRVVGVALTVFILAAIKALVE